MVGPATISYGPAIISSENLSAKPIIQINIIHLKIDYQIYHVLIAFACSIIIGGSGRWNKIWIQHFPSAGTGRMKGIIKATPMLRLHRNLSDHQYATNELDLMQGLKFAALNAKKNSENSSICNPHTSASGFQNSMSFRRVRFSDNEELEGNEACVHLPFPPAGAFNNLKITCVVIDSLQSIFAWTSIESCKDADNDCEEIVDFNYDQKNEKKSLWNRKLSRKTRK